METVKLRRATCISLSVVLLSVVCLAASSVPSSGALPAMWSSPAMISSGEAMDIAVDEDSMYVVGFDQLITSHDSGSTWDSVPSTYAKICADQGVLYRASFDLEVYYGATIMFAMSTDDGATWSDSIPILTLEGRNDWSFGLFKFGTRLMLYTLDGEPGGNEFGAMVKVAWSDDEGSTWSEPVIVDEGLYVEDPFPNDIVCANGVLYLTYYDQTSGFDSVEIIVAQSADMGATWSNAVVAVGPTAHNPIITADASSGELYVSYLSAIVMPDWTLVNAGPYFVKSIDGVTWSVPVKAGTITMATDHSGFHSLVASDGMIFEGYLDYVRTDAGDVYDLRISCSSDDGATWMDMGDVTGMETNSIYPILAIASERLHFIWTDYGSGNPWYDPGIIYHRSMPLGVTVFGEATVLRQKTGNPAGDAKTLSYAPDKDGLLWISGVSDKLPVLKVDVYVKGTGKASLVSTQYVIFGSKNPGPLESSMVKVAAGQEYLVKLTPYGMVGASAEVTGLFVAG